MADRRTAIVVGAGIGGMTAAVALKQHGWHVVVLERAAEIGEVGAGISIWPSTVVVLQELGIGVGQVATVTGSTGLRQPSGRWLVNAAGLGVEVPVMIHRSRLHGLIADRLGRDVELHVGSAVTGFVQDEHGVTVTSADGSHRGHLMVAADGVHSTVRRQLHPDRPGPRYSGYTAYRGIADVDIGDDGGGETWGRGRRFGFARLLDGRIYWARRRTPSCTTTSTTCHCRWPRSWTAASSCSATPRMP